MPSMTAATLIRAQVASLAILAVGGNAMAQDQPAAAPTPEKNLRTMVISLDFNHATIDEATNFLCVESKRVDPGRKGFNFVISPDASTSAKPVTMELDLVTFEQALHTVCQQAGVKYQIEGNVIHILSLAENPAIPAPPLPPNDKAAQATMNRLQAIIIDKINFQNLDIAVVAQFLAQKSKEISPDHRPIKFILGNINPTDHVHRNVSIRLDNVPLADVLQYLRQQTNLNYEIGDNIVTFKP